MNTPAPPSAIPSRGRILLVDDDPRVPDLVAATFQNDPVDFTACPSGLEALHLASTQSFDLVLLDLGLPDMSGLEVLASLKLNPRLKDVPIVILTAWATIDDKVRGFDLGAADYVTKPFETDELRARVHSFLKSRRLQLELADANQELEEARHKAESAALAKAEFLAHMSHEVRTPMNGVIALAELLLETELTSRQRELVETIRSSGDTLLSVVNEILDFSKIEAGKLELERAPSDLHQCLQHVVDLLSSKAGEKKLQLEWHADPSAPRHIFSDNNRLRQILTNLVSNAIKFTKKGKVSVQVRLESTEDPAGEGNPLRLRFSVTDTGIGIPPEKLARLFQNFTQADASTSRNYGGTGLGLAISKSLVETMGGAMHVQSTEGQGSTFYFVLPAEPAPPPEPAPNPVERPLRLLIVDDNATNRRVLELQARKYHAETVPADSADQALEILKSTPAPFDAAILDIQMPGTDGLALGAEIARQYPGLRMVLLGSVGDLAMFTKEQLAPFSACLSKPAEPESLFRTLFNWKRPVSGNGAETARPNTLDRNLSKRLPLAILLVDDNPLNLKVGTRLLEQMGYSADLAHDAHEAIQAIEDNHYDLVLMDVQMPDMDGCEATRRIREMKPASSNGALKQPVVVAMTANVLQKDRQRCFDAGMDDYLTKPVQKEILQQLVIRWAGRIHETPEQSSQPEPLSQPRSAAQPRLDEERLLDIASDMPDGLAELTAYYLDQTSKTLAAISEGLANANAEAVRRSAHSSAGASASIGVAGMSLLLRQIEDAAVRGCLDEAAALRPLLEEEFNWAREALNQCLSKITQSKPLEAP